MAKKKHRKTRKQKLQKQQRVSVDNTLDTSSVEEETTEQTDIAKEYVVEKTTTLDTGSHSYVKQDVFHSLAIVGVLLFCFGIIFFILNYTGVGDTVYGVIKL